MIRVSSLCALAVFASLAGANGQSMSTSTITVSATVTTASAQTTSDNGKVATIKQSLTTYKIGNRELLQLMVDNHVIPTSTGYALIQKFNNDGTPIGYFAWNASTHAEVEAPEDIFGFTTAGAVTALNKTTTQPKTAGGAVTVSQTVKSVAMKNVTVDGASCSLLDTITATTPTTGKIGTTAYTFTGVTTSGQLIGILGATGPTVSGTIKAATPKPFLAP